MTLTTREIDRQIEALEQNINGSAQEFEQLEGEIARAYAAGAPAEALEQRLVSLDVRLRGMRAALPLLETDRTNAQRRDVAERYTASMLQFFLERAQVEPLRVRAQETEQAFKDAQTALAAQESKVNGLKQAALRMVDYPDNPQLRLSPEERVAADAEAKRRFEAGFSPDLSKATGAA